MTFTFTITLSNSAGPLDSFKVEVDSDDASTLSVALATKLTDEWTLLDGGDSITITEEL
jgi:hypothetical protein